MASSISDVARRHQLNRNQLFQWRAQFRRGELGGAAVRSFVPVTISDAGTLDLSSPPEPGGSGTAPMIEVSIGGATARVPSGKKLLPGWLDRAYYAARLRG